jgi:ATP-dependent DNA ligase
MFGIGEPGGKRPSIPRPEGVYKDIDKATVDFVAYDFVPSEAPSHKGAVKDFYIGLIDPATGNIIPCGKCGGGMKRDDRFTYADSKKLPVAVSVIFKYWSKYGKTIQGSIVSVREPGDKHWTQCVATKTQLEQYLSHERITLPTR